MLHCPPWLKVSRLFLTTPRITDGCLRVCSQIVLCCTCNHIQRTCHTVLAEENITSLQKEKAQTFSVYTLKEDALLKNKTKTQQGWGIISNIFTGISIYVFTTLYLEFCFLKVSAGLIDLFK